MDEREDVQEADGTMDSALDHPGFFAHTGPHALSELAALVGADIRGDGDPQRPISDVRPLAKAGPDHISFIDNRRYVPQLAETGASAVLISPDLLSRLPDGVTALVTPQPYHGFATALAHFYPDALRPRSCAMPNPRQHGGGQVDASAQLEEGVLLEPGAQVGAEAQIGRDTLIGANAVIGDRCAIGRAASIGALSSVVCALIGDRVILHNGARIGQDGFGFAMGPQGHLKVPQIGRVILQDDVDIGAGTAIDRGALDDTVVGEGTKIDNLVQLGHNVVIGRNCVIVANTAIAGSTVLEDFVIVGGSVSIAGHMRVGTGAQIAACSGIHNNVPPGARWGGVPAQPMAVWAREIAMIKRMNKARMKARSEAGKPGDNPGS